MRIEERWIDCMIYLVGFYGKKEDSRLVSKILVFDSDDFDGNVEQYIFENFDNVKEVTYVDIWSDIALRPR